MSSQPNGRFLMAALSLASLLLVLLFSPPALASEPYTTVLLYHRIGENHHPSTSISEAAFRAQMEWLADHGYQVIPLSQLIDALDKDGPPPPRSVVITFDDTYRSIYRLAAPILAEYRFPYTLFVYTQALENSYPDFMSWEELRELASRPEVEVGNHGHHHAHQISRGEGKVVSRDQLLTDIRTAEELLTNHLGKKPLYYAAPYGEYAPESQAVVREAGYPIQLTQDRGSAGSATLLHQIPRNPMVGGRGTLAMLREVLAQPPLPWQSRQPATGRLPGRTVGEISIRLKDPKRYWPGQINLFLSELGRLDSHFDPETGWLRAEVTTPLRRRLNRITASARRREDNAWELTSWLIVTGD